jgi:N,N'-diacetyllegionaminate synthase
MRIGERTITTGRPPYIIAEIGVNHDGSVDRALELVDAASAAGADAVKLQLFEADRLLSRSAKLAAYQAKAGATDPIAMLRSLELSVDQMRRIVDRAREEGLHFIVTIFSMEHVGSAEQLQCDAYKTASPDIINKPLIEELIATGRPLILSTGAAALHEVEAAVAWVGEHPHILMQCISAYPTPEDAASLAARRELAKIDRWAIGYSDHTMAIDTGALAVAAGACVLEKHLTHDRFARGPDHAASLDQHGFSEYVRLAHRAWRMLGDEVKRVLDIENDVRSVSRQSITSATMLPAGHVLAREDITIKRPGGGIAPSRLASVIGQRLRHRIEADTPLGEDDLA